MKSRFFLLILQHNNEIMFNLFKTYNKVKDVFIRPKVVFKFGLWKNMSGLPMWRRGPIIRIANYSQYYTPNSVNYIKTYNAGDIKSDGTVAKYDEYIQSNHELPEESKCGVWKRHIRIKLRKYGLGWLKPQYILPIWLSFYIFDWDVMYTLHQHQFEARCIERFQKNNF